MTDPGGADGLGTAIEHAQRGDEAAFDRIYRALQPGLLRYLWVLVGVDAEDVASETWFQVARDIRSFHGDWNRFRGWAVTIARHRAVDHVRRQRRQADVAVDRIPDRPSGVDTAREALDALSTDAAIALIATLPAEQAEAIVLRVVFGLDAGSCGRILGRRAGAVRTAAHRGLRRLEQLLDSGAADAELDAALDGRAWRSPRTPARPQEPSGNSDGGGNAVGVR